uniref:Uncharacterized protein n=1 Tax=Arundo donax TaxID=35708 RepID=A0A0A9CKE7_ARUDO
MSCGKSYSVQKLMTRAIGCGIVNFQFCAALMMESIANRSMGLNFFPLHEHVKLRPPITYRKEAPRGEERHRTTTLRLRMSMN